MLYGIICEEGEVEHISDLTHPRHVLAFVRPRTVKLGNDQTQ